MGTHPVSEFEFNEGLIERYKALWHTGEEGLLQEEADELLSICILLRKQGFTPTADEEDWMPPFTPDAD